MSEQHQQKITDMRRAKSAWDNVKEIKAKSKEERKKYASRAKDIGALIMTTGLGAALAFLRAKATRNDQMPERLYQQISKWVVSELGGTASDDLLILLTERDTLYYRRATTETLAYIIWLKRFVEGEFKGELEEAVAQGDNI